MLLWAPLALGEWVVEERELMGTAVAVELWSDDPDTGRRLAAEALAEIRRLDLMMNPWNPDSELARINREAAAGPVETTPEIIEVLERALHYSALSEGAFDVSFASVGQHYDYRAGKQPEAEQIAAGRAGIDYRAIDLDPSTASVHFRKAGMQLDFGGIAKGYAVDRAVAILQAGGISSAVVSAGGDSRILGLHGERVRTIGIRHPRKAGEFAAIVPLANMAISTSGDYERFFIADGVRHHHILNPGTGESAREVQSASVLAPAAVDSDALSTTVFVLGVEKGLALVNSIAGIDAIIIDGAGKLHYSADLLRETQAP